MPEYQMPKKSYINFPSIGLKEVMIYEGGQARIEYKNDAELLAIVKYYVNREIVVSFSFVFVKGSYGCW